MLRLSTVQATTLNAFRKANPGPIGVILEDGQSFPPLVYHLTGETGTFDELDGRKVARCVYARGSGKPEHVNLASVLQSHRWCFLLFQATFGRDDLAAQLDKLLDADEPPVRLVLVNYHLDHADAKDDLRRLFALVPCVTLYFADAEHIFEINADNTANPEGARRLSKLFALMRKAGLHGLVTSYRQYLYSLDELGSGRSPAEVVATVRRRVAHATDVLFEIGTPWLPPKQEFDRAFQAVIGQFLIDPN